MLPEGVGAMRRRRRRQRRCTKTKGSQAMIEEVDGTYNLRLWRKQVYGNRNG
jgi:hypothetical protein